MILNIYYDYFQNMGMSQMCTGAGNYFMPSKLHSGMKLLKKSHLPKTKNQSVQVYSEKHFQIIKLIDTKVFP